MDTSFNLVRLPLIWLLAAATVIWITFSLLVRLLFAKSNRSTPACSQQERDWSIPTIDAHAQNDTPLHSWDPRLKILSFLTFWFCVASIDQLLPCLVALLISLMTIRLAKIPVRTSLKRIAALSGFIGMFLVIMPLTVHTRPGDHLLVFPPLDFFSFNLRGFSIALRIALKASAIALLMDPALGTSPFPMTLKALSQLRVPQVICQMLSLAHRYIFVFHHEAKRMATGMRARGFERRTNLETLKTMGNFLGMLFVRSFERTERVYDAMLARGYSGQFPGVINFEAKRKDWIKGLILLAAGLALVFSDRWIHLKLPYGF
jgi:cobalt/nickel transport system permease protein